MPWGYRVMRHTDALFGDYLMIHEVYDEGKSWMEQGARPGGCDLEELRENLQMMLRALDKPILEYQP